MASLLACAPLGGCYLGHVAAGHLRLLWAREPVDAVLADPATPPELRARLALVEEARAFARDLGLDVGGQYTSYVAIPGDRVVTSVVATRPGEVEPAGFTFPLVGTVPYKGFFDLGRAQAEAARLRERGLDVCLVAVPAYSTLGWTDDPLTTPLVERGEPGQLVETVIHELVHATVFWRSEPDLNESAARFVGEEGSVRFAADNGGDAAHERARVAEARRVATALLAFRDRVAALYAREPDGPARTRERARLEARAREELAALPLTTRDPAQIARDVRLNDACLALRGTYAADLPRHERLLAALGGDLHAYVAHLVAARDADDPRAAVFGAPPAAVKGSPRPESASRALRLTGRRSPGPGAARRSPR